VLCTVRSKYGHAQLTVSQIKVRSHSTQGTVTSNYVHAHLKVYSRKVPSRSTQGTVRSKYGHAQLKVQSSQSRVMLSSRYSQVKLRSRSAQGKVVVRGLFRAAQPLFGRKNVRSPENCSRNFCPEIGNTGVVSVPYQLPLCLIVFSSYLRLCLLYMHTVILVRTFRTRSTLTAWYSILDNT
jgi:hypothetical protein